MTLSSRDLYESLAVVLLGLSMTLVMWQQYLDVRLVDGLSYLRLDGWCEIPSQSVGEHCFGDYAGIDELAALPNPWSPEVIPTTPYPALAWVPARLAYFIGQSMDSWALGRWLYLIALALCMLVPALWVIVRSHSKVTAAVSFACLGVATAPFISVIDRANNVGFVVPFLLLAALSFSRRRWMSLGIAIVACAVIKPHMMLLVLLFLPDRKWKHATGAVLGTMALTALGFVLTTSQPLEAINGWVRSFLRYGDYANAGSAYPYNFGVARTLTTFIQVVQSPFSLSADAASTLTAAVAASGTYIGLVLALIVGAVLWRAGSGVDRFLAVVAVICLIVVAPSTSFVYYAALLTVPAAIIVDGRLPSLIETGGARSWRASRVERGRSTVPRLWWGNVLVVVVLAVSLSPLLIPLSAFGVEQGEGDRVSPGLLQVSAGPLLLLLLVYSMVRIAASKSQELRLLPYDSA